MSGRNILLTNEELIKAKKFADEVTETTYEEYRRRNHSLTKEQAVENSYRGKCGEIAVKKYLELNGYVVSEVDFKITTEKNHDADLTLIGRAIDIHIKTCRSNFLSWVFEEKASYVKDPKEKDFLCLVSQREFDLYRIESIRHIQDYDFQPTIKKLPSKLAIYL